MELDGLHPLMAFPSIYLEIHFSLIAIRHYLATIIRILDTDMLPRVVHGFGIRPRCHSLYDLLMESTVTLGGGTYHTARISAI